MVIYMDNAATSYPKPGAVMEAMQGFSYHIGGNPGRSGHRLSRKSGEVVYETRALLGELFNIADPLQIAFTLNATMAINLALGGLLKPGDHVITSGVEHNSLARPLRHLETRGIRLTRLPCRPPTFQLDLDELQGAIQEDTRLIALLHGSNVTGTIFPLEEIGEVARRHGLWFLVDAAQTAGAYPIDVQEAGVHLLAFTGHKALLGPQGTGGLYVDPRLKLEPVIRGGTGSLSEKDRQPVFMPDALESGTPNALGLAGLGAGVRYVLEEGVNRIRQKEMGLVTRLLEGLKGIPGIKIYGEEVPARRVPLVSFRVEGFSSSTVGEGLDEEYDIMTRVGLHCSPWAHQSLGTFPEGTVRVSLGYLNRDEEIDYLLSSLNKMVEEGIKVTL